MTIAQLSKIIRPWLLRAASVAGIIATTTGSVDLPHGLNTWVLTASAAFLSIDHALIGVLDPATSINVSHTYVGDATNA